MPVAVSFGVFHFFGFFYHQIILMNPVIEFFLKK